MEADNLAESVEAPSNLAESAEAPSNLAESAKVPSNLAESAETPSNSAESAKAPIILAESTESPSNLAESAEAPCNLAESGEAPSNLIASVEAPSNLAESVEAPINLTDTVEAPSILAETVGASSKLAENVEAPSKLAEAIETPNTSSSDKVSTDQPSSKPTGNDVLREEIEKQMDAEINNPTEKELFTNLDEDALLKDGDDSLGFTSNVGNIENSVSADAVKSTNNSCSVSDSSSGPNKSLASENSNKSSEETTNKDDVDTRNESPLPTTDSQENSRDAGPSTMSENSKDGELTKFAHQDVSNLEDTGEPSCLLEVDPFAQTVPDVAMEVEEEEGGGNVESVSAEDGNARIIPTEAVQSSIHLSMSLGEEHSASKSPMTLESETSITDETSVAPTPAEDPEVITGDKHLHLEAVLEASLIEDDISPDKQDSCSTIASKDHPYTLPPGTGQNDSDDLEIVSETPSTKKKLKVIYPKKKGGKKENEILVSSVSGVTADCYNCCKHLNCIMMVLISGKEFYLCSDKCLIEHRSLNKAVFLKADLKTIPTAVVDRVCADCLTVIIPNENNLIWETWEFCNEKCLATYQNKMGTNCGKCGKVVATQSLGKYCVRFGYKVCQFCHTKCLEEFKKGLKVCSFCQIDISNSTDGFLAAVGEKRQFKDFCSKACMERYDNLSRNKPTQLAISPCDVCSKLKLIQIEVSLDRKLYKLCSEVCFNAFKFVHVINPGHCTSCKTYFDLSPTEMFSIYYEDNLMLFCSNACKNVFILTRRKIAPCGWCKVKKYNFDMIERKIAGKLALVCSLNCLALYQVSFTAIKSKGIICDMCGNKGFALYHLTMSDATIRNFCGYPCVVAFQAQFKKDPIILPPGQHKKILPKRAENLVKVMNLQPSSSSRISNTGGRNMPVISSVGTLAKSNGPTSEPSSVTNTISVVPAASTLATPLAGAPPPQPSQSRVTQIKSQIIIRPPAAKSRQNKMTMTRPNMISKGLGCKPHTFVKHCQTDKEEPVGPILIPVPVPIYVPVPCAMYSVPCPMPMPFPLPIPVPIFVPTTRNSAKEIMEEIKRIQEKTPSDPLEAELLMMAEIVAGEKKDRASSDSENETSELPEPAGGEDEGGTSSGSEFSAEEESSNTFGDDMLQMALKMATELDEPHVDLDNALANQHNHDGGEEGEVPRRVGKKNKAEGSKSGGVSKKARKASPSAPLPASAAISARQKPDANMCLKYTFGVNAWKQWVGDKNAALEKSNAEEGSTNVKSKPFNVEILQLTADELNFALCMFIEEVKKPNGTEYAPDTIFYLCLGIQQYLFLNRRIDNIFYDTYYEKFTDCLNQIVMKFENVNNDRQYIVTRVEEEHLWECKQLGAHSPHVLLSTLMFFNTKYFNLTSVEEHMQLSFSHITKQCKRSPPVTTAAPGIVKSSQTSRNVLLRFYPPQPALEDPNSKKKKVYEQFENENPLRCPVKLYEFYMAKCPESVKSRTDVFYLQPERSCVPDSPVWYSTIPLPEEPLGKMLNRVKMVKEINIALLNS